MELSPVIWNIVLTAVIVLMVCTCYEARVITQWRWRAQWRDQARSRQRQDDATAAAVAANSHHGEQGHAGLEPDLVHTLPTYPYAGLPPTGVSNDQSTVDMEQGTVHVDSECAICQDACSLGEVMCILPCKHAYHRDCIHAWLARRATCPTCRLDVAHALAPPEDPLGEQQGGDHSTGGGESVGAGVVGPPPTAASSVLGDASYLQRHSCSTDHTVGSSMVAGVQPVVELPAVAQHPDECEANTAEGAAEGAAEVPPDEEHGRAPRT